MNRGQSGTLSSWLLDFCVEIGIVKDNRDQSPISKRCSHWRKSPLKPMLSATRKLAMTHRSISSLDFGSVAVWGEGLAWPCPPTWRDPGAMTSPLLARNLHFIRSVNDALPWVHGSIGESRADVVCGARLGESGPPVKPSPLSLGAPKKEFFLLSGHDNTGVEQHPRFVCCPRTRHRVEVSYRGNNGTHRAATRRRGIWIPRADKLTTSVPKCCLTRLRTGDNQPSNADKYMVYWPR